MKVSLSLEMTLVLVSKIILKLAIRSKTTIKPYTHFYILNLSQVILFSLETNQSLILYLSQEMMWSDYAKEFLVDVRKYGVSFTIYYFFIGDQVCGFEISTSTEASDNLVYSNLPIGNLYWYCVRSMHNLYYRDHPLDSLAKGRKVESSNNVCTPHNIHWEASTHGKG